MRALLVGGACSHAVTGRAGRGSRGGGVPPGGATPLHLAARAGSSDACLALLAAGVACQPGCTPPPVGGRRPWEGTWRARAGSVDGCGGGGGSEEEDEGDEEGGGTTPRSASSRRRRRQVRRRSSGTRATPVPFPRPAGEEGTSEAAAVANAPPSTCACGAGGDARSAPDEEGQFPYHSAWRAGHKDLSGVLAPGAAVDRAIERLVFMDGGEERMERERENCVRALLSAPALTAHPSLSSSSSTAHGAHTLATLASYAVRDGQMRGLCALQGGSGPAGSDSSSPAATPQPPCGVCWDAPLRVAAAASDGGVPPCGHALCTACAIGLVDTDRRPPRCPFCRAPVLVWSRVEESGRGGAIFA